MRLAKGVWKYPPAPQGFADNAEVFIVNDRPTSSPYDRYCGAWALPESNIVHKFMIPGAIREDGFFSEPIEAWGALEKHLKAVGSHGRN